MALVPKIFSAAENFSSSSTTTSLMTVVDIAGSSGVLGALSISPTRSSPAVSINTLELSIDGDLVLNPTDPVLIEALTNLLEEERRIFFRLPFRNSLQLRIRLSRPSTSGPNRAGAMVLVFVEE